MRVVTQDGRPEIDGEQPDGGHLSDAIRSWLVSGAHLVDRRRRFGSHGRARELLVVERPKTQNGAGRWEAFAAALHRHTVGGGLSELGPDHQRVISLAYLEGRTNREIAALLGVSVTTVRRRLWIALGLLEAYIARSGAWLSALLVLAAASAIRPATRLGHWINTAAESSDRAQRVATTLTAGAMSAAVLGLVAFTSDSATPGRSPRAATPSPATQTNVAASSVPFIESRITPPLPNQPNIVVGGTTAPTTGPAPEATRPAPDGDQDNGCDGNPTSAPPPVPVRSHGGGSPVTHPDAGGCRSKD